MEGKGNDLVLINEMAQTALKSVLPPGTTLDQAKAIIWSGQELGLQPFQALRSMAFIKGRLTMTVQLQLALAKRAGVIIERIIDGNGYCEVTLRRGEERITTKFSLEDAKRAGLIRPDSNWEKYPREMLRWRAIGSALRLLAPDIVMGLLSPEEAESLEQVEVIQEAEEIAEMEKKVEEEVKEKTEDRTQEEKKEEPHITDAQLRAVNAILKRLNVPEEKRHSLVSYLIKRQISSLKELTKTEASRLIDELQKLVEAEKKEKGEENNVSENA